MKLFSLVVLYKTHQVDILKSSSDLASFGYFQRSSVQEFMLFTSKLLTERTQPGQRVSVKEQDYLCHTYIRSDGLAAVLIADHEYPARVAFTVLTKTLDDFTAAIPKSSWKPGQANAINLEEMLSKYQNPKDADPMMKVQADLDETKVVLHNTIDAVLQRGEKLDDLVQKSDNLSYSSRAFYTTAKKTNSCCIVM
ncbi:Synaptobrevin-like protein YKT6 [Trichoplax sp. H2]|uniref:Uncharacterized protein n=1 Tax=Trichoplax adhaerens TaxID=10228 RepID=B3S8V4_TRIAD|nr:hypothetical protein TRIADDRAFT_31258 [Trichoplax adhaerens]EDV20838.1 hypothetical protein TRIADDRAFT_31258 [Trichoplax adhaerens]RDD43522.1 Synaptobrevin-like protein YKT6 [Trichoplax sp. H2]|eukprot:XP_002116779.1 hypothetical protein TRIADDRAFT_31258 [Trichoplax adhaerens]